MQVKWALSKIKVHKNMIFAMVVSVISCQGQSISDLISDASALPSEFLKYYVFNINEEDKG